MNIEPFLFVQGKFTTCFGQSLAFVVRLEEHKGGAISPLLDHINISDVVRSWRPIEDNHEKEVGPINEHMALWVQLRRGDVDVLQHVPKK